MDELKERYRNLPRWARLLLALVVGILPAGYVYYDEGEDLVLELEEANSAKESAQSKLDRAISKKKQIPEIEERLAELEEQLTKAKKVLPDSFRVEDVLQKTAMIAKETGVKFLLFKPEKEKPGVGDYKYMELPISTEIQGKFNQIAAFFDRLVHLDQTLFLRKIDVAANLDKSDAGDMMLSPHQRALDVRQKIEVKTKFQIVVYRSMTEREIAKSATTGGNEDEDGQSSNTQRRDQGGENSDSQNTEARDN